MPTYHYKCQACKREFEEFQGMSEDPLVKCPKCGKKKLVRIISGAGLVFKGSGFYLTDYKKQGSSHSDAPKETKPGDSSGKETKPAGGSDKETKPASGADKETKPPAAGKKGKGGSSSGASSGDKA
jgi:putative FmdB family regulatory protein